MAPNSGFWYAFTQYGAKLRFLVRFYTIWRQTQVFATLLYNMAPTSGLLRCFSTWIQTKVCIHLYSIRRQTHVLVRLYIKWRKAQVFVTLSYNMAPNSCFLYAFIQRVKSGGGKHLFGLMNSAEKHFKKLAKNVTWAKTKEVPNSKINIITQFFNKISIKNVNF